MTVFNAERFHLAFILSTVQRPTLHFTLSIIIFTRLIRFLLFSHFRPRPLYNCCCCCCCCQHLSMQWRRRKTRQGGSPMYTPSPPCCGGLRAERRRQTRFLWARARDFWKSASSAADGKSFGYQYRYIVSMIDESTVLASPWWAILGHPVKCPILATHCHRQKILLKYMNNLWS